MLTRIRYINHDKYSEILISTLSQKRQVFYKGTKAELLELRHDSLSRPILFDPKTGEFEAVRQDYDRFGHLSRWRWGSAADWVQYAFTHISEKVQSMPMRTLDFGHLEASGKSSFFCVSLL